jgi:predicted nucleotide-binding protein (sugar kinase/HSP70/actin superfamily)
VSKVGIPRTLAYFIYFPLWKTFFEELGMEVIVSPPTTRAILDRGVEEAVNDACIPIKLYHGHVAYLRDKADYIFTPRLVSVRKHGDFGTETFCPKFLGLPDMVRLAVEDLPAMIDARVDLKKGRHELTNVAREIGLQLGKSLEEIKRAQRKALSVHNQYKKLLGQQILPVRAMEILFGEKEKDDLIENPELAIAVVGYPYAIYDPYINGGLLDILSREKVRVLTQDMLSDRILNREANKLPKSLFWYFSNRAVYGTLHFMDRQKVDGVIHVTAFACGPDSIVDRLLEIEARRRQVPYLAVAIDEHTGEAGVRTRVEAFMDMLRFRKEGKM